MRNDPDAERPTALYVHVPFCLSVCPYCDFVVHGGRAATEGGGLLDAFQEALLAELTVRAAGLGPQTPGPGPALGGLDTVYLGGGTPSLLGAHRIDALLHAVDHEIGIGPEAEITIEVNPGPRDRGDLRGFVSAGVSRVSIGAQSLQPAELRRLGRRHTPNDVAETIGLARAAGARSVSVDLLYDVPGQTVGSWRATLDGVIALEPDHVSAYALTLDDPDAEGLSGPGGDHLPMRPGARRWRAAASTEQDADRAAQMYRLADDRFERAGLHWYEVSNWSRPGYRCRHNLVYWQRRPHLALGPGAHGFDGTRRWWNAARLAGYLQALRPSDRATPPTLPPGGSEALTDRSAHAELAILGLRLADGLDRSATRRLRGDDATRAALEWGKANNLLSERRMGGEAPRLALTMQGRLLADELFVRMI